jgi:hypothetical protein
LVQLRQDVGLWFCWQWCQLQRASRKPEYAFKSPADEFGC